MKIDGRKAEITRPGKRFDTYVGFAVKHGYPDAAYDYRRGDEDTRKPPQKGDIVTLLVSGEHDSAYKGDTLWIVEAVNGERHIMNEKGLRILDDAPIDGVTVLPDESLGGLLREYREVKRKAAVGERIKIVDTRRNLGVELGDVLYVIFADRWTDGTGVSAQMTNRPASSWIDGTGVFHDNYVVLEPTEIIRLASEGRIGSERFRMVDRKAAVGERVVVVKDCGHFYKAGNVARVKYTYGDGDAAVSADFSGNAYVYGDGCWHIGADIGYRVLEPVISELPTRPATEQTAENIAALTAKVQALESRVAALEKADRRAPKTETFAEINACLRKAQEEVRERRKKSPQQIRDEIVERAKADVAALTVKIGGDWRGSDIPAHRECGALTVKFVVNRDKRKVTALLHFKHVAEAIAEVGRAKCAPNDVFNAHIGKAIAVRRALGLEVPAEYLSVPSPTEVRVGDVVISGEDGYIPGTSGVVTKITGDSYGGLYYRRENRSSIYDYAKCVTVTDDSREGAELSASSVKTEGKGVAA